MDDNLFLSINPGGFDLEHLPSDPRSITVKRAGGAPVTLDPRQAQVHIATEHPEVERMEGDWGAICEVFRKNNYYYASIAGLSLAVGDEITIRYQAEPGVVTFKVIDIENGRARIDPPVVTPGDGRQNAGWQNAGRQNP